MAEATAESTPTVFPGWFWRVNATLQLCLSPQGLCLPHSTLVKPQQRPQGCEFPRRRDGVAS